MKEDSWLFNYAVEQMRLQRHDFMNFLQVIFAYLQINKYQDAMDYVKEVNKKMTSLSRIFNLECPLLSLFLQDQILSLYKQNIDVDFYSELEYISSEIFTKNIEGKKAVFERVKKVLSDEIRQFESDIKMLYFNISGSPDNPFIFISSSQELMDTNNFDLKINGEGYKILNCESDIKTIYYSTGRDFLLVMELL